MLATIVGAEGNTELGPVRGRFVEPEPRHTKNDRVVGETRDIELDALGMRTDVELDRKGLVSDVAGGNGAAVGNLQRSRRCLETETDGVRLGKGGINEGRTCATVNHGDGLDLRALCNKGDREDEEVRGSGPRRRKRGADDRERGGRCGCGCRNRSRSMYGLARTRWMAQKRVLYCL
jgi:hypothetical protein